MHIHYYFLKRLSQQLHDKISEFTLLTSFSQNRDELILGFASEKDEVYLRANLSPEFSCLSFPENFQRAKKNSTDIFPEIIGKKVLGVRQIQFDRSLIITLSGNLQLIFKMHGNRSNVLLANQEEIIAIFRNALKADFQIDLNALAKNLTLDYDVFKEKNGNIQHFLPVAGKQVKEWLSLKSYDSLTLDQQWHMVSELLNTLENGNIYLYIENDVPILSLLPKGSTTKSFQDPFAASNAFYSAYVRDYALTKEKKQFIQELSSRITNLEVYLATAKDKLKKLDSSLSYSQAGDLLMANLHLLNQGDEVVRLNNFYDNNAYIKIKLKKDLSPQKNAEQYYRKAKNQHIEIARIEDNIASKKLLLSTLEKTLLEVMACTDLRSLRNLRLSFQKQPEANDDRDDLPYHRYELDGFVIMAGKNAKKNDVLTFKVANKNDLWLHAKDSAGSHVVIKEKPGQNYPKHIIEKAASIAAWYSKRKNEIWCPVSYTPRKYVRKPRKAAAGAVLVERENVVLVKPALIEKN